MFLFLAEVEHSSGFMSMFENNVINWLLFVGFIYWIMAKNLPPVFAGRETSIKTTLAAAEQARSEAEAYLIKQKEAVANAEAEADKILAEAKAAAKEMQASLEAQTQKDIAEMLTKFENAIASERQVIVNEMRQASVKAAMALAKAQLTHEVTPEVKANLLNQFMEQLETLNTKSLVSSGALESVSK